MVRNERSKARWWPVAVGGAVLGAAVVAGGAGPDRTLAADDKPAADAKKDAKPAFKPEDVRVGAPPELEALRKAVEEAGKKGENVDEVRKQLEALETALAGKAWVRPTPPADVVRPAAPGRAVPPVAAQPFPPFPGIAPFGGVADPERLAKAQDEVRKALEKLKDNPDDQAGYQAALDELRAAMQAAVPQFNGFNGRIFLNGGVGQPNVIQFTPVADRFGGRDEGRLGVSFAAVPPVLAEQLDQVRGRGVVVSAVRPGSAAEKAGLKANDVVVEFAGKPVTDATEFLRLVYTTKTGEKVDAAVVRKGKRETVKGIELPDIVRAARPPAVGFGGAIVPGIGVRGVGRAAATSMTVNGDRFTLRSTDDGVVYTIDGRMEDGKAVPTEIFIEDNAGATHRTDTLEKVPAEFRDKVDKLLAGVRVNGRRGRE